MINKMSQSSRIRKRFRPHTTVFHSSSKILPELLEDVMTCYLRGNLVCKVCYYRRNLSCPITYEGGFKFCQECKKFCESLWLMPSSRLCENFGDFSEIPIPGMPSWARRNSDKPLSMCQKDDHYVCYERSANSDIWFAHTIEELVIWTIEREYNMTFRKYIEKHHPHIISTSNRRQVTGGEGGGGGGGNDDEDDEEDVDKWRRYSSRKGGRGRGRANYSRAPAARNFSGFDLDEFPDLSSTGGVLDPEKVEIKFQSLKDIPSHLLEDIAKCYIQAIDVCKFCFYCRLMEVKKPLDWEGYKPICLICKSPWKSVKVIPASSLCSNFNGLKNVPISVPLIKPNRPIDKCHSYCSKSDHLKCFELKYDAGFTRAHSVEELVIWTVEKDSGVGYGNFSKYIKDNGIVSTLNSSTNEEEQNESPQYYVPEKCLFTSISSIPNDLLFSISKCYESRLTVCRTCFFDSLSGRGYNSGLDLVLTLKAEGGKVHTCERGHMWRGLRVIPSSRLCSSYGEFIAIPPVPKHMQTSKSPFKVCSMADHRGCFEKTRENNPWFPHAVEEMVIWTVERETGKDFQSYQSHIKELYEEQRLLLQQLRISSPSHRQYNGSSPSPPPTSATSASRKSKSKSPNLESAVSNLVDGLQTLRKKSQPDLPTLSGINESNTLRFHEDLSSSSSDLIGQTSGVGGDYNMSLPSGGESLTYDEASKFFPALMDQRPVGTRSVGSTGRTGVLSQPELAIKQDTSKQNNPSSTNINSNFPQSSYNPLSFGMPPTQIGQPPLVTGDITNTHSLLFNNSSLSAGLTPFGMTPSTSTVLPNPIGSLPLAPLNMPFTDIVPPLPLTSLSMASNPSIAGSSGFQPILEQPLVSQSAVLPLQDVLGLTDQLMLNDDDNDTKIQQNGGNGLDDQDDDGERDFTCFLCYREFDTPREIAEHCMKERHLEIVRQDTKLSKLWRFFPPPPDQTPEDFKICNKKSNCPGRYRCCKAHSPEELQEWTLRHKHRQINKDVPVSPSDLLSMDAPSLNHTLYGPISITIEPSHQTVVKLGNTVSWRLNVKGEAWQTLVGVVCVTTPPTQSPVSIMSIKGDTIYSIFPRSQKWAASTFKESVLLGRVSVLVKATPTKPGFNEYHVRLYFGCMECIDIELKVLCQ
uniref:C2H2-type domain-containing protein n=2 Tax=Amphimedon queenslandica TaxID=400682 RepID=A0A1X7UD81_AMPQE